MAKKSTKTAHVLNLISKPTEQDPAVQADETQATEHVQQSPTSPLLSSLKETAKNEELSDKIKDNLLAELLEEESANTEPAVETAPSEAVVPQECQEDTTVLEHISETTASTETLPEVPPADTTIETVSQQPAETVDAVQTAPEVQEVPQPELEVAEVVEEPEEEFHFINVGEMLIKDKVMEYIEKFDVCPCSRCVADTMAIALSNLTPKYVVSDDSNMVPFLSYYDSKFSSQIMTELTKACLTVSANPRHKTKNS